MPCNAIFKRVLRKVQSSLPSILKNEQKVLDVATPPEGERIQKKHASWLKQKYVNCESWAPNGKPAGKITGGNGEWIIFPNGGDPEHKTVIREVYKDSVLADVDTLTTTETGKWTTPN